VRLLLDTCTFLWLIGLPDRLSTRARDVLAKADNTVFLSVISSWEIAVKVSRGRLEWQGDPQVRVPRLRDHFGIRALPLDETSALQASDLPHLHRDPFDRLLVCQAITHGLTIVTPDEAIRKYPVSVLW